MATSRLLLQLSLVVGAIAGARCSCAVPAVLLACETNVPMSVRSRPVQTECGGPLALTAPVIVKYRDDKTDAKVALR
ncbi:MAG: hypothetical protein A2138_26420 [Deltaproteobacteria bacterium RBG_16_71_12]|nr:MAG: hypothetical protein A2138_26420 [Deltaproteobacteria bacterium RBG_16_71_12]